MLSKGSNGSFVFTGTVNLPHGGVMALIKSRFAKLLDKVKESKYWLTIKLTKLLKGIAKIISQYCDEWRGKRERVRENKS